MDMNSIGGYSWYDMYSKQRSLSNNYVTTSMIFGCEFDMALRFINTDYIFNSKDRDVVNIGFRLGGNLGEAKGKAWFSDFKLEEGVPENDSDWNFACFIFKTTSVNINNSEINLKVTDTDIKDIENTISRFENSCYALSEGKMTANCDIYELDTPLSKLSYDKEFGYYVAPEDVENQIKNVISSKNYDHIFVVVRLR